MNVYSRLQSLKIQRDNNGALSCAKKEGVAEGLELGEHKKAIEMAVKLKAKNTYIDEILELTGLPYEEIEAL